MRGDDLSEDELKELNIRRSVESEDAAQKILSNFGRIAKDTQPIVLCFDNLDAIPKRNDKSDLQPLMNVNTTIHNERLKNFLVLISVISDTWRSAKKNIQPADLAGIGEQIDLKPISLDQAEAIWASRLHPLHQLAKPKPESAIAPLTRDWLEAQFPGGKTLPRTTLMLGKELLEYFKKYHVLLKLPENASGTQPPNGAGASDEAQFKLIWDKEFEKTKQRVTRLRQFSSPELIQRLRESLEALDVKQVKTSFLSRSTYAANSLSFHNAENIGAENIGVVWTEESNMSTFYHVMNACRNVIKQQLCTELFLIRAENVGKPKSRGNQIYQQLFIQDTHIKPNLDSIYFLETYHSLVNSACSRELVVGQRAVSLKELQAIVRETRVLKDCPVLQELLGDRRTDGENSKKGKGSKLSKSRSDQTLDKILNHIVNIIETQNILGRLVLFQNVKEKFNQISEDDFDQILTQACKTGKIQVVNPDAKLEEQLICLVPS
ncbi:MAG: ATP-binding protein [Synechococcales cyanobacterium CRU_2_2]|nr:ATP-binding protein [Synechococcales cyanobacterium CRU_2_2]